MTQVSKQAGFTLTEELVALAISGVLILGIASVFSGSSKISQTINVEADLSQNWLVIIRNMNKFVEKSRISQSSLIELSDCVGGACRNLKITLPPSAGNAGAILEVRNQCVAGKSLPATASLSSACTPLSCDAGQVPAIVIVQQKDSRTSRRQFPLPLGSSERLGVTSALCMQRTGPAEISMNLVMQTGATKSEQIRRAGALVIPRRPSH